MLRRDGTQQHRVCPCSTARRPDEGRFFDNTDTPSHAYDRTMALPATHPPQLIAALAHTEPELLISDGEGAPWGAVFSHAPVQAEVQGLQQHAIVLHLSGSTLVEKWCEGRLAGHRSRIGSVSLVPALQTSRWVLGGHSRVLHLYVEPALLVEVAAAADSPPAPAQLRDFFAEDDPQSAALLRRTLLRAQRGLHDRLAHDELLAELLPHLMQRHAAERPLAASPQRLTLTGATLRRLFALVEEQLHADLRLAEMAAVARLSDDHFLRAFKAAVGVTPHRYVLDRRIARSQQLLARSALPVAEVARTVGFRGASHFAAAFRQRVGLTPSAWRVQRS
jgi:AraC family transcriptional regulator